MAQYTPEAKDTRPLRSGGRFEGIEVEHTPFRGARTLFICRSSGFGPVDKEVYSHVYICLADKKFYDDPVAGVRVSVAWAHEYLTQGFLVTIDCRAAADLKQFTGLRKAFPFTFVLLVTVEVPLPDMGGFAVKVEPVHVFTGEPGESGVYVANFNTVTKALAGGFTEWSEYAEDKEV